jgi:hypothetical protein
MSDTFHEGQKVVYIADRSPHQEAVVEKVGRKLAHVRMYGRLIPFRLDDGVQSNSKYGTPDRISTPERMAAAEHRRSVISQLSVLGIGPVGYRGFAYSTPILEQILAIAESAADGD